MTRASVQVKAIRGGGLRSLTKELAPSAFFGHVKGAFTGADCAKKGYFHEAEGGTLFLDEVGNLALETQQMLAPCHTGRGGIARSETRQTGVSTSASSLLPMKIGGIGE